MATLTHNTRYPCVFDLKFLRWEQYTSEKNRNSDIKTVALGEPYTLWVEYCMSLRVGNRVLYQSEKDTTLILEDIKHLIEDLRRLAHGKEGQDSISSDSIHKKASIYLEEVSWWVFAPIIEWLRTNGHCWNTKSLVAYTHLSVNVTMLLHLKKMILKPTGRFTKRGF